MKWPNVSDMDGVFSDTSAQGAIPCRELVVFISSQIKWQLIEQRTKSYSDSGEQKVYVGYIVALIAE